MMLGFGMGFGVLGIVFMLVLLAGLVFVYVWITRSLFQMPDNSEYSNGAEPRKPKEILDQRYSRGEITREQYEIMKKDISP